MTTKYKTLQILPDPEKLDGYCYIYGKTRRDIYINVQRLWERAVKTAKRAKYKQKEDYFAEYFANTYTHEMLHFVLRKFYRCTKKWEYGEEMVIWSLMDEKLAPKHLKYYKKEHGIL